MSARASLRTRLTLIILVPLMLIAIAVGLWQVGNATTRANDLFDRALMSVALAIASDVDAQDGDAVSLPTRDLLNGTSGGAVFYHVYAPDGAFVTGYATPPAPVETLPSPDIPIAYYNGLYKGADVRVIRLKNVAQMGGLSGTFTTTVWQKMEVRRTFVREVVTQSFLAIAMIILTVTLVVWFGVKVGLKPLFALEEAISIRNPTDLRPIQRSVPVEAQGLVRTLNNLLAQVSTTMAAQKTFISNAAHQLRNPIAGVLAMAEAVQSAPTEHDARSRAAELVTAAGQASDLANKLLTLERVQSASLDAPMTVLDLRDVVRSVINKHTKQALSRGIEIQGNLPCGIIEIYADRVMVREAISNILDNALKHGGPALSRLDITLRQMEQHVEIEISDDGIGVALNDHRKILDRFGQAKPGEGSGLGLSIAEAVANRHGGRVKISSPGKGLVVTLTLPRVGAHIGSEK